MAILHFTLHFNPAFIFPTFCLFSSSAFVLDYTSLLGCFYSHVTSFELMLGVLRVCSFAFQLCSVLFTVVPSPEGHLNKLIRCSGVGVKATSPLQGQPPHLEAWVLS